MAALREPYASVWPLASQDGRIQPPPVDARPAPRDAGLFLHQSIGSAEIDIAPQRNLMTQG
jgi:hypothetical protein